MLGVTLGDRVVEARPWATPAEMPYAIVSSVRVGSVPTACCCRAASVIQDRQQVWAAQVLDPWQAEMRFIVTGRWIAIGVGACVTVVSWILQDHPPAHVHPRLDTPRPSATMPMLPDLEAAVRC